MKHHGLVPILVLCTLWTAAYVTVMEEGGWVLWIPALLVLGVGY